MEETPFIAKMSTVIRIPLKGINTPEEIVRIDAKVQEKVKQIIEKLKSSHEKFSDPDFGPNEKDIYGSKSLYGSEPPAPSGSKYPTPESLRWDRPKYADDKFDAIAGKEDDDDEENSHDDFGSALSGDGQDQTWCKRGKLFKDGTSSGDVLQGNLGDCWFLGALAVMGANENLLRSCFWPYSPNQSDTSKAVSPECFKEYGLFVLRFFKDSTVVYVVIDDRLPVSKKNGKLVFASCKDPNELWVPFIEKAYAKIHGSYKALIGGYVHYGLGDMTGYCPRLLVLKPGFPGYAEKYTDDQVWDMLLKYQKWKCLMGCSIQPDPKANVKVEAKAADGLIYSHAYSLLGLGEINVTESDLELFGDKKDTKLRLVKVRNPWGHGEWEGAFSDRSDEREKEEYKNQIDEIFNENQNSEVDVNFVDGTFIIPFKNWIANYNHVFIAVKFPSSSPAVAWQVKRCQGSWAGDVGGNRKMGTWISNPKIKINLNPFDRRIGKEDKSGGRKTRQVFIGIYIKDSRLTKGGNYYKDPLYVNPVSFDIVTEDKVGLPDFKSREKIMPLNTTSQPPYNHGAAQIETELEVGIDYYIVPSLLNRSTPGTYFIVVSADVEDFTLDGDVTMLNDQMPMKIGPKPEEQNPNNKPKNAAAKPTDLTLGSLFSSNAVSDFKQAKMSMAQFYEKKEQLRERMVLESKRLRLTTQSLESIFPIPSVPASNTVSNSSMSFADFKRRLMDLGFNLADFPDDDLIVLDEDNSGAISKNELVEFFKSGVEFLEGSNNINNSTSSSSLVTPSQPVDDLLFKTPEIEGFIDVKVISARGLRKPATWFNNTNSSTSSRPSQPSPSDDTTSTSSPSSSMSRNMIKYNPQLARQYRMAMVKLYEKQTTERISKLNTKNNTSKNFNNQEILDESLLLDLDDHDTSLLLSPPASPVKNSSQAMTLSNLNKLNEKHGFPSSGNRVVDDDAKSVMSIATANRLQHNKNIGMEAGIKLHSDLTLQTAEMTRTMKLLQLKKEAQKTSAQATVRSLEEGRLLTKKPSNGQSKKSERRSILSDPSAMAFLNYKPAASLNITPSADKSISTKLTHQFATSSNPKHDSQPEMTSSNPSSDKINSGDISSKPKLALAVGVNHADFRPVPDLWDLLIDSIFTIKASQSKNTASMDREKILSSLINKNNKGRSLHRGDVFSVFDPLRSSIPTPTPMKSLSVIPKKITKGNIATPKNPRIASSTAGGYASVTTPQSQAKQKMTIQLAKERLKPIEENQKNEYEEVFCRLVSIPTTSYHELEGDRYISTPNSIPTRQQHQHPTNDSKNNSSTTSTAGGNNNNSSQNNNNNLIRNLFMRFDRNANGLISREEFELAMKQLQIDMSPDDCRTLFDRFETSEIDGQIDYQEFLDFFDEHVKHKSNLLVEYSSKEKRPSLEEILCDMKVKLQLEINHLIQEKNNISNENKMKVVTSALSIDTSSIPEHKILSDTIILNHLHPKASAVNVQKLKVKGIDITIQEMNRINRLFNNSIKSFMNFMSDVNVDIKGSLSWIQNEILVSFMQKAGTSPSNSSAIIGISAAQTRKLWSSISGSNSTPRIDFLTFSVFLTKLIEDVLHSRDQNTEHCDRTFESEHEHEHQHPLSQVSMPSSKKLIAPLTSSSKKVDSGIASPVPVPVPSHAKDIPDSSSLYCSVAGVPVDILCRIVTDAIMYSEWNKFDQQIVTSKSAEDDSVSITEHLSLSGFEAFVRNSHVNALETKLRYLVFLEHNSQGGAVNLLVHVYINLAKDDVVILAHDPTCGAVYKLQFSQNLKDLPLGDELQSIIPEMYKNLRKASNGSSTNDLVYHYNPWETPSENTAIAEVVDRLRLVIGQGTPSQLIFAEDPKFVQQLKTHINSGNNDLPFFSVVNELLVSFEVDAAALEGRNTGSNNKKEEVAAISMEKVVFGSIRKCKTLYSFISNSMSTLNVVLTTYNGARRNSMTWADMLSYLCDYRNPFVTIQLLPKVLTPDEYFYDPDAVLPAVAFTGEEERAIDTASAVLRGPIDIDGGCFPQWNSSFVTKYDHPKLTSCKIISKEIAKMKVDGIYKYVLVMVREGKKESRGVQNKIKSKAFHFLTIYDPKTATDYQCGLLKTSKLYKTLMRGAESIQTPRAGVLNIVQNTELHIKDVSDQLIEAINNKEVIVGPALTPRLLVNVYNKKGKEEELLGSCQVSVSAVLSNSGSLKPLWTKLTFVTTNSDGKSIDTLAGEIQVDLSFRSMSETEGKKKSEKMEKLEMKEMSKLRRASITAIPSPRKPIGLGDSTAAALKQLSQVSGPSAGDERGPSPSPGSAAISVPVSGNVKKLKILEDENAKIVSEREALSKDLTTIASRLKEEVAKREAAFKESEKVSKENEKLKETYSRLQEECEKLKKETEVQIEMSKKSADQALATAAASAVATAGAKPLLTVQSTDEKSAKQSLQVFFEADLISNESFNEAIQSLLRVLIHRHDKKNSTSLSSGTGAGVTEVNNSANAFHLLPLEKMFKAYTSDTDGFLNARDICSALSDIMIAFSLANAKMLIQTVGESRTRDFVAYQKIISYLKRSSIPLINASSSSNPPKSNKPSNLSAKAKLNTSQVAFAAGEHQQIATSELNEKASASMADKKRPLSASSRTAVKPPSSPSPLSSSQRPNLRPTSGPSHTSSTANKPSPIAAESTESKADVVQPLPVLQPKNKSSISKNNVVVPAVGKESAEGLATVQVAAIALKGLPKNWDIEPLPDENIWSRRLDLKSQKHYYLNHETKSTQWHHPLDPNPPSGSKKSRDKKSNTAADSAGTTGNGKPKDHGWVV